MKWLYVSVLGAVFIGFFGTENLQILNFLLSATIYLELQELK